MTNQPTTTFAGDALNRHEFAEGIYKLVQRLDKGVIAIDGEWGVGKSRKLYPLANDDVIKRLT